jgi:uncharacterized repeat protein (TIGR03803 family)
MVQAKIVKGGPPAISRRPNTKMSPSAVALAFLFILMFAVAGPSQAQTEKVLYSFQGSPNATTPEGPVAFDSVGNLFGIASGGQYQAGAVYKLSPNGSGTWREAVIYSFTGGADGGIRDGCLGTDICNQSVIADRSGKLYGTMGGGGAYNGGVVFELSHVGGAWTETVLHSFGGSGDGLAPTNGLIMDKAGNLYGVTQGITVFELSPSRGGWKESIIYADPSSNGNGGLTMDSTGNIFGATYHYVFELSPNGTGGWNSAVLHTFTSLTDGVAPCDTPVVDSAGNVYGTTFQGGTYNLGIVYKLSLGTTGTWNETILHSFKGANDLNLFDGSNPFAGLVLDAAGNLYGTTVYGGHSDICSGGSCSGTAFELIAPVGIGSYKEKILRVFGIGKDGAYPYGRLIFDSAGNLYGTTSGGGTLGGGTVFKIIP